jgi:hypothetical protein
MLRYHFCGSPEEIPDIFTSGEKCSKLSDITEQIYVMVVFSIHLNDSI